MDALRFGPWFGQAHIRQVVVGALSLGLKFRAFTTVILHLLKCIYSFKVGCSDHSELTSLRWHRGARMLHIEGTKDPLLTEQIRGSR